MRLKEASPYFVVTAGDGSFRSTIVQNLEQAIRVVEREFGEKDPWIQEYIMDRDNWDFGHEGEGNIGSDLLWRGEQCYFRIFRVTAREET